MSLISSGNDAEEAYRRLYLDLNEPQSCRGLQVLPVRDQEHSVLPFQGIWSG